MKIIIYYHNDADGIVSAGIIRKKYPKDEIEYIKCQYGDDISIQDGYDKCYLVDFSFDNEIMERLYNIYGNNFIWIDHHISVIKKIPTELSDKISGIRKDGTAACELTWKYCFPDKDMPLVVRFVGDYDVWKFEYKDTKPFGEYFALEINKPDDIHLSSLLFDSQFLIEQYIFKGKILLKSKADRVEKTFKGGFDAFFEGCNTRVMFTNHDTSEVGNYAAKQGYDIGLVIAIRKNNITFSLRSIGDVDVSIIATKYNGGGHKNASGFEMIYDKGLKFIQELKNNGQ